MGARNLFHIVRCFIAGPRTNRGVVPSYREDEPLEQGTIHKEIWRRASKKKQSDNQTRLDSVVMDEFDQILPQNHVPGSPDNHEINGEVCLLTESPFRILRMETRLLHEFLKTPVSAAAFGQVFPRSS